MEKKKRRKIVIGVLFFLFGAVFAFSAVRLLQAGRVYRVGSETYESLAQTAVIRKEEALEPSSPEEAEAPKEPLLNVDFEMLHSVNEQVIGWIYSGNEEINYPIVQGEDNDYYLRRLVDGTYNSNGSIFMDYRNSPAMEDRNTLIYGHNMGNHTMFASLLDYSTEGYYEENPVLILQTPEESYYLEVFSGYVTDASSTGYRIDFADDGDFSAFLEEIRGKSEFETGVEVTAEDRIVTLATCSYRFNDARYVLHCKLVPA